MFKPLLLTFAILGLSSPAFADHPGDDKPSKTVKTMPQLPNEADIENIMADMPDLNAIMGDMMKMMSNPKFQNNMKRTGEKLAYSMENSGAMEPQENGLPDFNAAMSAMLSMMTDKDTMGGMMEMMGEMAVSMEKHIPETKNTP